MEFIFRKIERLKEELDHVPLRSKEAMIIVAKMEVLNEVLQEGARKYRIALLKCNQEDFDRGLISIEQYQNKIEEVNQLKNG